MTALKEAMDRADENRDRPMRVSQHPVEFLRGLAIDRPEPAADEQKAAEALAPDEEALLIAANEAHVAALTRRAKARAEALTLIARARVRGGGRADLWTPAHADIAFNVLDLVLEVQNDTHSPLDPAFQEYDRTVAHIRRQALIERAARAESSEPTAA